MAETPEQAVQDKTRKVGYTKAQLLGSAQYTPQQRDVMRAILAEGKTYTHDQVKQEISRFMRKVVE